MNMKKCVSLVESGSKKSGKSPLYWQNSQGFWISDTGVCFNLGMVSLLIPEVWREYDMGNVINDKLFAGAVPAEMTDVAVMMEMRFGAKKFPATIRLFKYGKDYLWFNQAYLEVFGKNEAIKYLIKDPYLLAFSDSGRLKMVLMRVSVPYDKDVLDEIKAFAKWLG